MKDLVIVGAGGCGREVLQWAKDINRAGKRWNILGFINDDLTALMDYDCEYSIIGTIEGWMPEANQEFACAIADPAGKETVVKKLKGRGAKFASIIHPSAIIGDHTQVGEGLVMWPNSIIDVNVKVGDFVTLLSSAIGHDAQVGDYCTISSYCDITGGVKLSEKVFLGSHVTVIPKKKIGVGAYVGAGSVVMANIKDGSRVMGNPAVRTNF